MHFALDAGAGASMSTEQRENLDAILRQSAFPVGLLLVAAGLVLYARLPVDGHYFCDLFPPFLLSGIGMAFAFIPATIGALAGVRDSDAGVASGLINTTQQIGGAIGVAAATTIATTFTNHYVHSHVGSTAFSAAALTHGFQVAFYALAATAAVGAVVAALLIEPKPAEVELETDVRDGAPEAESIACTSPSTPLLVLQ